MPFSTKLEQEYRELVQDNFNKVTFSDEKDFDSFCHLVDKLITASDIKPTRPDEIKPGKLDEDIQNLRELIDGFDLYATDRIIDLTTHTQTGRGAFSPWVHVPAFTSDHEDKALKITEARIEFKTIIIDEIRNKNNELKSMSPDQKTQYIIDLRKRRDIAQENHRIIAEHKAQPSVESVVNRENAGAVRSLPRAENHRMIAEHKARPSVESAFSFVIRRNARAVQELLRENHRMIAEHKARPSVESAFSFVPRESASAVQELLRASQNNLSRFSLFSQYRSPQPVAVDHPEEPRLRLRP